MAKAEVTTEAWPDPTDRRIHAKAIAPLIGAAMMAFTEKRSPDAADAHYRDVAEAMAGRNMRQCPKRSSAPQRPAGYREQRGTQATAISRWSSVADRN